MNWFLHVVRDNYANFQGRARRQEYWMFVLFYIIGAMIVSVIDKMLFNSQILSGIYGLALLIPSIAVGVRRLHDTERSGWWMLLALIPVLGGLVLLVFMCLEGTTGANRFGNDPKQVLPPSLPPSLPQ